MPERITLAEAGKILGVSRETVRSLVTSGKLPAIDVGAGTHRSFRILRSDLEAFISKATVTPPPKVQRQRNRRRSEIVRNATKFF